MAAHNHTEHEHQSVISERALKATLGVTLGIMVVELIGGLLSNSLALIGDAGHMLVDTLSLGLSLFAVVFARRPATSTRTYGFHRAEIMAALANGTTLILVSVFIFYESYRRFLAPPEVHTPLMLIVAGIGLMANMAGIYLLHRSGQVGLNIRAALWHIVGDTISSLGVIGAGLIIMFTGWSYADPLLAVFIGVIILVGAVQLVRESIDILMEAVPKEMRVDQVIEAIKGTAGVEDVHDIHIWTITSGIYALSAHLVVNDITVRQCTGVIQKVNDTLADKFRITHTSLQMECDTCATGNVCGITSNGDRAAANVK